MTFTTKIKKIFDISDIDINKILVSKKQQNGKHNIIRPIYLFVPETTG